MFMYFYLYVFTKAVHIELASHLTSEAFLATLTRFVARRGVPKTILSYNGTIVVFSQQVSTFWWNVGSWSQTIKTLLLKRDETTTLPLKS